MKFRHYKRFTKQSDGATAIEFAIIAPVLFLMIFAIIEFGYIMLTAVVVESATNIVSRNVRLENAAGTGDLQGYVRARIKELSSGLINSEAIIITTDARSYQQIARDFETCLATPRPPRGTCPSGASFIDANGNGRYDGVDSTDLELDGALIRLNVLMEYSPLTFVGELYKQEGEPYVIRSTTFVKKEPA